jgi:hypothetical protein
MKKILITFAGGYIAVLLAGMLFYRLEIFNIYNPSFQVAAYGLLGAILYPMILYREKREVLFFIILFVLVHFLVFNPYRLSYIFRDVIALSAIIISIIIYTIYIIPLVKKRLELFKVVILALLYGLINAAAGILLLGILYVFFEYTFESLWQVILIYFTHGVLIGAGLAIGFNFAELVIKNLAGSEKNI